MKNKLSIGEGGLDLIIKSEGIRLDPYNDGRGFATIGVGHLLHRSAVNDTDKPISEAQAKLYLREDTRFSENTVNDYVEPQLNQNQFDAIVDFVFNVGSAAFLKSSVFKYLNSKNFMSAMGSLMEYIYAGSEIEQGLVNRRRNELLLFNRPL